MFENCCSKDKKEKKCFSVQIAKWLLIIGGINWGLIGIGMLLGSISSWNIVHLIFGGMPWLEGVVYVLVGISAIIVIFGCKCKNCSTDNCCPETNTSTSSPVEPSENPEVKEEGTM